MRWLVLMSLFGVFVTFTMGISGQSLVIIILAIAITLLVVYYEGKLEPPKSIEPSGSSGKGTEAKGEVDSGVELIGLINQQGYDLLAPFYFDSCNEFNNLPPQEKQKSLYYFHKLLNEFTDKNGGIRNLHKLPLEKFLALHEQGMYKMEIENPNRIARHILFQSLSLFVQCPNIDKELFEENWENLVNADGSNVEESNINLLIPATETHLAELSPSSAWPFSSGARP